MGALAFDHFLVVRDEGVQLLGQGRKFGWVAALHPLGPALADRRHLTLQVEQGLQAHPHLDDHRRDQPGAQQDQQDRGPQGEAQHVPVDRRAVLGGHERHRRLATGQGARQGHRPQRLILRADGVVIDCRAHGQRAVADGPLKVAVPERAGADQGPHVPVRHRIAELPVPAGKHPERAGVGEGRRSDLAAIVHRRPCQEAVGHILQAGIETADGGGVEDGRQRHAGDRHDRDAPAGGQPDQPTDQRGPAREPELHAQFHASAVSPWSGARR